MYNIEIKRSCQKTAMLKTALTIFLRNDCNGEVTAVYASYLEFHGSVLVTCLLHLIYSSVKGSNNTLHTFYTKMWLKQATLIIIDHFTSSAFWLGPFMTKMNTLEVTARNAFNFQDFELC